MGAPGRNAAREILRVSSRARARSRAQHCERLSANARSTSARSSASQKKSSAVIASAFAPSSTARSPASEPAHFVNSALWIDTCGGATAIIGWIDGTRWLTLPMSVLPCMPGGSLSYGKNVRPERLGVRLIAARERPGRVQVEVVDVAPDELERRRRSPRAPARKQPSTRGFSSASCGAFAARA